MKCKEGFVEDAPLCAICKPGYIKQLRKCDACEEPRFDLMAVSAVFLGLGVIIILYIAKKYGPFLRHSSAVAHAKILVSFIMVAATVDTQFGVAWPPAFLRALKRPLFPVGPYHQRWVAVDLGLPH